MGEAQIETIYTPRHQRPQRSRNAIMKIASVLGAPIWTDTKRSLSVVLSATTISDFTGIGLVFSIKAHLAGHAGSQSVVRVSINYHECGFISLGKS